MNKNFKAKLENILFAIVGTIGALTVAGIAWIGFIAVTELDAHLKMYEAVGQQLGFRFKTSYLEEEGGAEALILTEITKGGIMDRAGFREQDRYDANGGALVIPYTSLFVFHQGEQIMVPIIRGTEHLKIPIMVPQLKLDVDPWKFHYPFTKYKE